jgi:hypothetical protein
VYDQVKCHVAREILTFVRMASSRGVIDCDMVDRKRFPAIEARLRNIEIFFVSRLYSRSLELQAKTEDRDFVVVVLFLPKLQAEPSQDRAREGAMRSSLLKCELDSRRDN